jgi:hypothetical protein
MMTPRAKCERTRADHAHLEGKTAQKPGSNAVLGRRMGAKTVISPRKNVNGNAQNILTFSTRLDRKSVV